MTRERVALGFLTGPGVRCGVGAYAPSGRHGVQEEGGGDWRGTGGGQGCHLFVTREQKELEVGGREHSGNSSED